MAPDESVSEVVQPHLLGPHALSHPRDGHLAIISIGHWNLDHDRVPDGLTPRPAGAATVDLDLVIAHIILEELTTSCAWGWALHLSREVATWVDGSPFTERIRDLLGVDILKLDAHPEAAAALVVVDENKLPLLSLRDIGK